MMAFPTQKQKTFFLGHVHAFAHFEGVPHCLSYDNLKPAVNRILQGRNREEQTQFTRFHSHYLFDSRFCTPGQGHEKGGVESAVGYGRRNFLVPTPQVTNFDELNRLLVEACRDDDLRTIDRSAHSIGQRWREEHPPPPAPPTRPLLYLLSEPGGDPERLWSGHL